MGVRLKSIRADRWAAERLARGSAAAALSKQTRKNDWPPTPNDLNNAAGWIFFFPIFGGVLLLDDCTSVGTGLGISVTQRR